VTGLTGHAAESGADAGDATGTSNNPPCSLKEGAFPVI
jgi:hypothetical protein